jgi:hypothetical protein
MTGKNRQQLDQSQWTNASIEFPFHISQFTPAKHTAGR